MFVWKDNSSENQQKNIISLGIAKYSKKKKKTILGIKVENWD